MTYEGFVEMVKLMRLKQKAYFKTRNPKAMKEAVEMERRVDAVINREREPSDLFDLLGDVGKPV